MTRESGDARQPIDFVSLAAALLDGAERLVPQWLPGGTFRGHEYVCADLTGGEGSSCSVNIVTGAWADFSTDERGRDLISLYAAIRGLGNGAAARELMDDLGLSRRSVPARDSGPPSGSAEDRPEAVRRRTMWRAVVPVPRHAPPVQFRWGFRDKLMGRWHELQVVASWRYEFEGELFGYVARFHRTTSRGGVEKETIPFTWCVDDSDGRGTQKWHPKQWEAPRPLYVPAGMLGDAARRPVVVVEGEKCAAAGHALLGGEFDFVSWPGGAKAWALARWGWLMGRTVYLWPDRDARRMRLTAAEREAGVDAATKPHLPEAKQPGMAAMLGIGSLLMGHYGCTVFLRAVPRPDDTSVPDGWDIADAIADGWDAARVRDYIRGSTVFVPPDDAVRAAAGAASTPSMAAAEGEGKAADDARHAWMRYLLTSATGSVRPVRENIVLAVDGRPDKSVSGVEALAGLIGFNEFTNNVEKRRPTPWGTPAGDWLEADELMMGDWLVREHQLPSVPRAQLEEAVLIVAKRHSFHPLRERMVALRGRWDRQARLDTWLRRVCLEEDEFDDSEPLQRYLTLAGRWFLMGMVARVLPEVRMGPRVVIGPGAKFDYMLILEGPGGWFKSSMAKVLGGEYFADTGLRIGEKDSLMNIQGIWVYEWGELEGLSRQEVTKVKGFISSPVDLFRATFDRRPAKYPRQVVFIGTTNESHYLTDVTGNRRFWPVRVTRPADLAWLAEHREQLLAEAVHRVEAGERFWPDRDEQRVLFDPQQAARTVESSLESAIVSYLYDEKQKVPLSMSNGAMLQQITVTDLLARVGYTIDKQTDAVVKKAGALMHKMGWEVKRLSPNEEGKRPRVYVRPRGEPWSAPHSQGPGASQEQDNSPAQGMSPVGADDECPF